MIRQTIMFPAGSSIRARLTSKPVGRYAAEGNAFEDEGCEVFRSWAHGAGDSC